MLKKLFGIASIFISSWAFSQGVDITSSVSSEITICDTLGTNEIKILNSKTTSLQNVEIGITLPKGVTYQNGSLSEASNKNIAITRITQDSGIVLSSNNINAGDSIVFSIGLKAEVASIAEQNSGLTFRNRTTITFTGGTKSKNSNSYNILYPVLAITEVTPENQSIISGTNTSRTIKIINGGNGRLSTFWLVDNRNISTLVLDSSNKGQIYGDSILLKGIDFVSIGNNDEFFDQYETMEITQYISGTSCTDQTIESTFRTFWGCNEQYIGSSSEISNISLDFQTPNLSITSSEEFGSCFGSGTPFTQQLTIRNTGNGVASNVIVDIFKSKGRNYDKDILSKIDISSLYFQIGINGQKLSPINPVLDTSKFSNLTCLGANPIGKSAFNVGSINPGDTLFVFWDMISCCIAGCGNQAVKGWKSNIKYSDVCGTRTYTKSEVGQADNQQYASIFSEAPADIFDGQTEIYTFTLSSFTNTLPIGPGAKYKVVFTADQGLDFNALNLKSNNSTWTPSSTSINASQNTFTATYKLPQAFNLSKAHFELELEGNCSTSGWKNIAMSFYYIADTTCTSVCEIPLICNYNTTTFLHCSGTNCSGLAVNNFRVVRTNFGSPDNNLDGSPDGSGTLNQTKIKTNRAMVGDTISAIATALVKSTSNTWEYAQYSTSVNSNSALLNIGTSLKLFDASNSTWYTFNNIPTTSSSSGSNQLYSINISENVLKTINTSFAGFQYANGDSIELTVNYTVNNNPPSLLKEITFSNEFYVSNYSNPTSTQKNQCSIRNGRFTLIGYQFRNDARNYRTLRNCTQIIMQNFGMSIGTVGSNYAGGNLFPFEYRNWSFVKDAIATIPDGYDVESAKIIYYRTTKTNGHAKQTIKNIVADSTSGNSYFYNFEKYFTGGTLTLSDDGYSGRLEVTVTPKCTGTPRGYEDIDWKFTYQKNDILDNGSTHLATSVKDKIRYIPTSLTLSSLNPNQAANSKLVKWDYKIKNNSSSVAENVWVHLKVPSTFSLDSVVNDKNDLVLEANNGFYEFGYLGGNQTADLSIYGKITNCDTIRYIATSGYSCDGYPTDLASVTCSKKELELKVQPRKSQYQVRLNSELMPDPCLPKVSLNIDITSVELAHIYNMKTSIFSTDTNKIKVIPNSSTFKYGANPYTTIQTPANLNGSYSYNLDSFNSTYLDQGIPGIKDIPNNSAQLKFMLETGTNFQPGDYVDIQVSGKNTCEDTLPTMNFALDLNSKFEKNKTAGLNLDLGNSWSSSWGDYDNDGYDDLFVPINDISKPNILYHNNGNGTFSKVTTGAIVSDIGASVAGTWGDYNNDGYIDLFVANNVNSENKLYKNNGNSTFTSITNSPIVDKGIYSHAAAWADYNRDGNLDLVVSDFHPTNFNYLFLGDGNGGFSEDTKSDVALLASSAVGVSWGDYDNDGDPDLFISNTNGENNQLFNNQAGILKQVTTGSIVNDGGSSVGSTWGDYDNDGDLDLYVTNSRKDQANFFYKNNGNGSFTKIENSVIVLTKSNSHGASWIDYDNDGYLDLIVANDDNQPNFLFRNNGDESFTKITNAITQENANSYGTAWSDFDNDGDYDLIVANRGDNANDFFINAKGSCTNHIVIELQGCNSNSKGIGALINVKSNINGVSLWQTKDVATQNSAMGGQNSSKILFGLGDATSVDSIIVVWPSGIVTHLSGGTINATNTIIEQCGSKVCGVVFNDENGNGVQDSTELGIPNQTILVNPGNFQVFTGNSGNFQFYLEDGTFTLKFENTANWSQSTPTNNGTLSLTVNSSQQTEYCGNNFGATANCTSPDLKVSLGNSAMRRGLLNELKINITNEGAYATSSNVSIDVSMSDEIYLTDTNYTSITTSNNLRTYTFSLGQIAALSDTILELTDSIDVYSTLNDTLTISAEVSYSGSECDTLNNVTSISDIVVGSIDPNDKHVFVSGNDQKAKINFAPKEKLNYKIRFQNLGNYAAKRVEVVDTLSSQLDWSTFKVESSSHPFSVSIIKGIATWINENIELPDSTTSEQESNGFVCFSISPREGIAPYTVVNNTANIQFDRNPFIKTNNAPAVVGLDNLKINTNTAFVYPNPTDNVINAILIDFDKRPIEILNIQLLNMQGNLLKAYQPQEFKAPLDVSEIAQGLYNLKITSTIGEVFIKRVIIN